MCNWGQSPFAQMCNWGQSPFALAEICSYRWLFQVTKGDSPQFHMRAEVGRLRDEG